MKKISTRSTGGSNGDENDFDGWCDAFKNLGFHSNIDGGCDNAGTDIRGSDVK